MSIVWRRALPPGIALLALTAVTVPLWSATPAAAAAIDVRINEVESNQGVPGDWVELFNPAADPADIGGFVLKDNDDGHVYTFPAGTTIAPGGYLVADETQFGYGLGAADTARLFAADGATLIDSYAWTSHAPTSYGRCPDGSGAFQTTTAVTSGTANDCSAVLTINEVESSGGTPGDWIEIFNPGPQVADASDWIVRDNDDTHTATIPAGTTIAVGGYYVVEESALGFGLGSADSARLFRPDGSLADTYSWTAHASTTYGRCPNGTGPFTTTSAVTKGAVNGCGVVVTSVHINEVESNGGSPGDWIELINTGATAVDLSGWTVKDNDDAHVTVLPTGSTIAPGGYLIVEEALLGYGLGAGDSARLFDLAGSLYESYTWTAHASTTYGRCPNGTGELTTTTTSTKGAANDCGTPTGPTAEAWPGGTEVQTVDGASVFGGNMSGLAYEGSGTAAPGVLWAVRNGPGALFRLVTTDGGATWGPDPANDWSAGKALHYANGTGNTDAEGVTFAGASAADGIYVSTERNNDASGTSRNVILRFDPNAAGTSLNATHEWDLTADLPATGANLGLEAITWVPDSYLVGKGFTDASKGHAYNPGEYPNHGTGLFFVGVEANGFVYAYALDHVGGGFTKIATITTGFPGVMDVQFDRDAQTLWAICDNTCAGRSVTLDVTAGAFAVAHLYERPPAMPDLNNEGFAMASAAECAAGVKPVFWADDGETGGHAIRKGTLNCSGGPEPVVPEFPLAPLGAATTAAIFGVWIYVRRRQATAAV